MPYKDKNKQKEANRQAQARFKAKAKGITEQGITNQKIANQVIPNMRRGKDIKCFEDLHPDIQANIRAISETNEEFKRRVANAIRYQHLYPDRYEPQGYEPSVGYKMTASERASYKPAPELRPGEFNHVSKPGDPDYDGVCTEQGTAERQASP